ncbi:Uncharacterised protein [Vibrio cholerae]|nr:Uncharacterised protein [Vibrio cholerae]
MCAGVFHLWRSPTWPRHTVSIAMRRATFGRQRSFVEGVPVLLVCFQALWALSGVTNRPHTAVKFTGDVFNQWLIVLNPNVFTQLICNPQFLTEQIHDFVIRFGFKQRLNHLITPLNRTVRRRHTAVCFKLSGRWKQIHSIGAIVHYRRNRWVWVNNHHHIQLLHRLFHFHAAGLRVHRMTPIEHGADVFTLLKVVFVFKYTIDPTRDRDPRSFHWQCAVISALVKAVFDPLEIHAPYACPVFP